MGSILCTALKSLLQLFEFFVLYSCVECWLLSATKITLYCIKSFEYISSVLLKLMWEMAVFFKIIILFAINIGPQIICLFCDLGIVQVLMLVVICNFGTIVNSFLSKAEKVMSGRLAFISYISRPSVFFCCPLRNGYLFLLFKHALDARLTLELYKVN